MPARFSRLNNALLLKRSERLYSCSAGCHSRSVTTRGAHERIYYAKPLSWLRRLDLSHQIDLMILAPCAGLSVGSASAERVVKSAVCDSSRRTVGGVARERASEKNLALFDRPTVVVARACQPVHCNRLKFEVASVSSHVLGASCLTRVVI